MVYRPPNTHYAHVTVGDIPDDVMDDIMGYKGAFFKAFTEVMKLKYVWWNKDSRVIELWGPFNRLLEARTAMVSHVESERDNRDV